MADQEPLVVAIKSMISAQIDPEVAGIKRAVTESKQIVEQMNATLNKQRDENQKAIADQIATGLASITSALGKVETRISTLETSLTQQIKSVAEENRLKRKKMVDYLKATPE